MYIYLLLQTSALKMCLGFFFLWEGGVQNLPLLLGMMAVEIYHKQEYPNRQLVFTSGTLNCAVNQPGLLVAFTID